jgi:hypothetical protein
MARTYTRRYTRLDRIAHTIRDINTITREISRLIPWIILVILALVIAGIALAGCTEHVLSSAPWQHCPAGQVRVHLASGWTCEK